MVTPNLSDTPSNSFSVSASGFNSLGSYTLEPSGNTVYFSSPTSQPSYILFTATNGLTGYNIGSLTVSNLPPGQNLNVIVVGGGGGGGGGGGCGGDQLTGGASGGAGGGGSNGCVLVYWNWT